MNVHLWKWFALLLAICLLTPSSALAEDVKIEAKLIWGTNDDKSPNPKHKLVDPKTAEELRKVFAWKNYFEVNRQIGVVRSRTTNSFTVSKDCTVEIEELEGPKVGVRLIGKGKPQNRTVKALSRGELFVLGGDVKDGSAWFVIISQLDEKAALANESAATTAVAKVTNGEAKPANPPVTKATNTASK